MINQLKTNDNLWLVYINGHPEMGSEGSSSRFFFCVAEGNTKEEIIQNYIENVKLLYGEDPDITYSEKVGHYYQRITLYSVHMVRLPGTSRGRVEPIHIIDRYTDHDTHRVVESIYTSDECP